MTLRFHVLQWASSRCPFADSDLHSVSISGPSGHFVRASGNSLRPLNSSTIDISQLRSDKAEDSKFGGRTGRTIDIRLLLEKAVEKGQIDRRWGDVMVSLDKLRSGSKLTDHF